MHVLPWFHIHFLLNLSPTSKAITKVKPFQSRTNSQTANAVVSSSSRIHYLDLLRGIAIVLVVALHTYQRVPDAFQGRYFLGMGVPLFLIISGSLVIPRADKMGIKEFYRRYSKRLIQFVVLIPICGIITNALVWYCMGENLTLPAANAIPSKSEYIKAGSFPILSAFVKSTMEANGIFPNPLTMAQSHTWYLYFITGLYIAAPYISRMLRSLSTKQSYLLCALCLLAGYPAAHSLIPILHAFNIKSSLFFILGFVIICRSEYDSSPTLHKLILILGASTIGWDYLYGKCNALATLEHFRIPLACVALTIFCKNYLHKINHIFITSLSECSFGIYLWHFACLWLCSIFLPTDERTSLTIFIQFFTISLVFPWLLTLGLRRLPYLKWLVY